MEVAHDVELVGILGRIGAPLPAVLRVPGDERALDVRGEARVVQHLHGIELVEVNGGVVDEAGGEFIAEVVHGWPPGVDNSTNVRIS